jgi:two-component system, NarL family, invasion response regulator UvrY
MTKKYNIVLVDDHVIIRNGLKELIEKLGPYSVTAQFSNGAELLEGLERMTSSPHLIVMDVSMPEMDAEATLQSMNERTINVPVLILTLNQDDERVITLFRLGVRGYLQKTCSASMMADALSEVFRCGYYHNEFLTTSLQSREKLPKKSKRDEILNQLTDRERDFLKLVCDEKEYTYEQVAGIMKVQHRTVDGYRESLFDKFAIKSKTGLVLFVLRNGLLDSL